MHAWQKTAVASVAGAFFFAAGFSFAATSATMQVIQVPLDPATIPKYVEPVPDMPEVNGKEVRVEMLEFQQKLLPAEMYPKSGIFSAGTFVWGFKANGAAPSTPGPTFEQRRFVPTTVVWINNLTGGFDYAEASASGCDHRRPGPFRHHRHHPEPGAGAPLLQKFLTVDQTLHWADPLKLGCMFKEFTCPPPGVAGPRDECCTPYGYPSWQGVPVALEALPDEGAPVPAVIHYHGGENPSAFDGHPEAWFTPNGLHGPTYASWWPAKGNEAVYRYTNAQEASTYWYHDHSLGVTRIDNFAGLAGVYLVRDRRDTGKQDNPIRLPAGAYERELVLQDRSFDTNGQLLFPDTGVNPTIHPFWIPEFFGDVIMVNGKAWPYLTVEPRRYRLRLLNASNARFYRLTLDNGGSFWQIGSDGGLLDAPVELKELLLGVAERADVVVDFAGMEGKTITVKNDAPTPFPGGDPVIAGLTDQVMQFRVAARHKCREKDRSCNPALPGSCELRKSPIVRLAGSDELRQLVLVEVSGDNGPLEVLLNNTKWSGLKESTLMNPSPVPIPDSVQIATSWYTELPQVGATEVWEIANLTEDAHPIHIHLIQFQLLDRQGFNADAYFNSFLAPVPPGDGPPLPYNQRNDDGAIGGNFAFSPFLLGGPAAASGGETGWKDTVIMYPGQVTRIIARFAPQDVPLGGVLPGQNLFSFDPTLTDPAARDFAGYPGGPGYVWHCHILDHEDNEMMRPYAVRNTAQVP